MCGLSDRIRSGFGTKIFTADRIRKVVSQTDRYGLDVTKAKQKLRASSCFCNILRDLIQVRKVGERIVNNPSYFETSSNVHKSPIIFE